MNDRHDPWCLPCIYYGKYTMTCDYILIEDHSRPCPGGPGCTARKLRKDVNGKMKAKWDTQLGRQLWLEGKKDKEIAEQFGIAANTVTTCRRKHWEQPARAESEMPQAPEPVEVPTPAIQEKPAGRPLNGYEVLEAATGSMQGIYAICTADAILCLWNWTGKEDLLKARDAIDYLIQKMEERT